VTQKSPLVLLIDDDDQARRLVRVILESNNLRLLETGTAAEGARATRSFRPDAILSELSLPDETGAQVVRQLRASTLAPILVVSHEQREEHKVAAFAAGADDYITKPFGGGELVARIRAAIRRGAGTAAEGGSVIKVGELTVDLEKRVVSLGGAELHLTPIEYKLLTVLMRKAGAVISTQDLLEEVWGPEFADRTDYLRVYVSQLRQKLEHNPAEPTYLLTQPGVGYRIRVSS
jgi:two-component system KDP operon response regulator KdpE